MKPISTCAAILLLSASIPLSASADFLGTSRNFAVLGGSTVTNTGISTINGDLGVWPGTAVTGVPPAVVNGTIHTNDAVAQQAQADVTAGYDMLALLAPTANLTGSDMGGMTLTAGVYFFSTSAQLTGTITLDGGGNADALFVFQIGSTLTTASAARVNLINGADGCNIYWQVGSSATLGTSTEFNGNIFAMASITLNTSASILDGRALARSGAVTLDSNSITADCIPAPGCVALLGSACLGLNRRRRS